jgi:hypothetical protein
MIEFFYFGLGSFRKYVSGTEFTDPDKIPVATSGDLSFLLSLYTKRQIDIDRTSLQGLIDNLETNIINFYLRELDTQCFLDAAFVGDYETFEFDPVLINSDIDPRYHVNYISLKPSMSWEIDLITELQESFS